MIPNSFTALVLAALVTLAPAVPSWGATIKKCQDAEGRWHYGDTAAEECERSRITVIDKRGLKVDEVAAPKTQEQLDREAREEAEARSLAEEQERQRAEQAERDQRLLTTYDSEQAIERARDQRLQYFDRSIGSNNELMDRLREQRSTQQKAGHSKQVEAIDRQIDAYEAANATAREQRAEVEAHYKADLERYRELRRAIDSGADTGGR
jgi:hypothetical protein